MANNNPLDLDFATTPTRTTRTTALPTASSFRPAPTRAAGPSFGVLFAANFLGTLAALLVAGFLAFGAVCSFITNVQNQTKLDQQKIEQRTK